MSANIRQDQAGRDPFGTNFDLGHAALTREGVEKTEGTKAGAKYVVKLSGTIGGRHVELRVYSDKELAKNEVHQIFNEKIKNGELPKLLKDLHIPDAKERPSSGNWDKVYIDFWGSKQRGGGVKSELRNVKWREIPSKDHVQVKTQAKVQRVVDKYNKERGVGQAKSSDLDSRRRSLARTRVFQDLERGGARLASDKPRKTQKVDAKPKSEAEVNDKGDSKIVVDLKQKGHDQELRLELDSGSKEPILRPIIGGSASVPPNVGGPPPTERISVVEKMKIENLPPRAQMAVRVLVNMQPIAKDENATALGATGIVSPDNLILGFKAWGLTTNDLLATIKATLDNPVIDGSLPPEEQSRAAMQQAEKLTNLAMDLVASGLYTKDLQDETAMRFLTQISNHAVGDSEQSQALLRTQAGIKNAIPKLSQEVVQAAAKPLGPDAKKLETILADVRKGENIDEHAKLLASELKTLTLEELNKVDITQILKFDGNNKVGADFPNLKQMNDKLEQLQLWVAHSILASDDPKERRRTMAFMIKVMNESYNTGDFNTAGMIFSGLNNASMLRMNKLKDSLDKESKRLLSQLQTKLDPVGNYRKAREETEAYRRDHPNDEIVPLVTTFLAEKTLKMDGTDSENRDRSLNIEKCNKLANLNTRFLQQTAKNDNRIQGRTHVVDLGQALTGPGYSNDELYDRSLRLEPRKT